MPDILLLLGLAANEVNSLYPYLSWPYKKIEEALKIYEGKEVNQRKKD